MGKCNANLERLRGYKVKLYPTESQKAEIDRNISISRAVYNIGIDIQKENYAKGNSYIKYYEMSKRFIQLRNTEKYNWLNEVALGTIRETLLNLNDAFMRLFKQKYGFPKYKSKKYSKKAFNVRSERTYIKGNYIQISGLKDNLIDAKNHIIPQNTRLYNPVVSFDGYNYWFSCCVERPMIDMDPIPKSEPIGVDVGLRNMIVTSDMKSENEFEHFSDRTVLENRLKRQQRRLSKDFNKYYKESIRTRTKYEDVPKSNNHYKRLAKLRKTYDKIRNKIHYDINCATKRLVDKNPSAIVIENLSVSDMYASHYIRRDHNTACFAEMHRQIKYKAADRGIPVIIADREFPSSQICSRCGAIRRPGRNFYKCDHCGLVMDRDLNAALNLKALAYQY